LLLQKTQDTSGKVEIGKNAQFYAETRQDVSVKETEVSIPNISLSGRNCLFVGEEEAASLKCRTHRFPKSY